MSNENLIAPCGMNCGLCAKYLAYKNDVKKDSIRMAYCKGCRIEYKKCAYLKKKCDKLLNNKIKYCFECDVFPCKTLTHMDERYKKHFKTSVIQNLNFIKDKGIRNFLINQKTRWKCKTCGDMISCHNGICFNCELDKLRKKRILYRW